MESENGSERLNSSNRADVHTHKQAQSDLQTLAELAAKATASFTVDTDVSIDSRREIVIAPGENATSTAITTTPIVNTVITIGQANDHPLTSEIVDKPLSQKSDDSDGTIQSDQSERNVLKQLAAQSLDDKRFSDEQTLDRILLAHSEQRITTARVELDRNSNAAVARELVVQGGSDEKSSLTVAEMVAATENVDMEGGGSGSGEATAQLATPTGSIRSIGSLVCRICHNSENPERLVSPCLCKGSLTYVHIHCLERWISTSRSTVCELCQFQYNTVQTLRYTCLQSLRMWYSRSMSRRALQEDCQMFSLLTLVAFGIIGTLLVGIQYYFLQGQSWGLSRMWTKGWLVFFLFTTGTCLPMTSLLSHAHLNLVGEPCDAPILLTTRFDCELTIYFINIYMILKSQLGPWYRWWQSARDIKLILENRKPFQLRSNRRLESNQLAQELSDMVQQQQQQQGIGAPPSGQQTPQANSTTTTSTPYQPNQPAQPTTAAISIPIHMHNIPIRIPISTTNSRTTTHLPITINTIEQQCNKENNNKFVDFAATNANIADDDVLSCCAKRPLPLVMARCKRAAVALHCNKLTTAAAIEIPLESCLYEFETVL